MESAKSMAPKYKPYEQRPTLALPRPSPNPPNSYRGMILLPRPPKNYRHIVSPPKNYRHVVLPDEKQAWHGRPLTCQAESFSPLSRPVQDKQNNAKHVNIPTQNETKRNDGLPKRSVSTRSLGYQRGIKKTRQKSILLNIYTSIPTPNETKRTS